jgi:hypothetical protein
VHALAQDRVGLPAFGGVADEVGELGLHGSYTFCMQTIAWIILVAILVVLAFGGWLLRKRWIERSRAARAREAEFMAKLAPGQPVAVPAATVAPAAAPRKDTGSLPQQKLLFEAAAKAAEAGEPVLSIQLYARLLARYPDSGFAAQVRAAVEVQKNRLAKG